MTTPKLSKRVEKLLEISGLSFWDLPRRDSRELLKYKSIGQTTLDEANDALQAFGVAIGMGEPEQLEGEAIMIERRAASMLDQAKALRDRAGRLRSFMPNAQGEPRR